MKEEQKIYIRGSKNRPDDVRKILEQNGGEVIEGTNFTLEDSIYYINHDGIIDYAPEGSELFHWITEYFHEIKWPNHSESWQAGDILVNNNDSNEFYVFDKFAEQENIFVHLKIIKNPREDKILGINDTYHLIPHTLFHKANDKELKTFHDILAERNLTWNAYNKELLYGNYTYFYPKNGHYYFRRDTLRCKDRITGEWYKAVLYSDANGQYVRELNDFNTKFKKV